MTPFDYLHSSEVMDDARNKLRNTRGVTSTGQAGENRKIDRTSGAAQEDVEKTNNKSEETQSSTHNWKPKNDHWSKTSYDH